MSQGRPLQRERRVGCALAMALLGACATGHSEARDENLERIEGIVRRAPAEEPIPEGIAFVPDTAPLDEAGPEEPLARVDAVPESVPEERTRAVPCVRPPHGALLPAPVPLACLLVPGPIEYRLEPRPGGSIPGLLP